jgi:pyruvate/2-oxoglutarate dehydrogenase complex dihydrolipoamide dehydrogenase (E3) component
MTTEFDIGPDLRTANARVFAIPDEPDAVHLMRAHSRNILRHLLFRLPPRSGAFVLPRATLTDPSLAHVGLTEAEARAVHGDIRVLRAPFAKNERATLDRAATGTIKIVTTSAGKLLGVTIIGPDAGELIATYALALAKGMNLRGLADLHVPHPVRAEVGQAALLLALLRNLTSGWVRRIITFLRQFA